MAIQDMQFDPITGLEDVTQFPTKPASETAARQQVMEPSKQIRDYINETVLPAVDPSVVEYTPDQTQVPATPGTGIIGNIVSWITNRIKAITGATNWWDNPDTTLAATKTHIDATTNAHGGIVPSSDVATTAAANKILKLNADSKLPADITGDAATVGGKAASTFATSTHNHALAGLSEKSYTSLDDKPTSLPANGGNADTLDTLHAASFQLKEQYTYGTANYTDAIEMFATLTKNIAMGASYQNGKIVFRRTSNNTFGVVYFGTDAQKSHTNSGLIKAANSTSDLGIEVATGTGYLTVVDNVSISGSNIVIDFKNNYSATRNLGVEVYWFAW
jgi:hypothetical protein